MTELLSKLPSNVVRRMEVFQPYRLRRLIKLAKDRTRLVYYTSAETGLKILDSRKIWMRQASCMNDHREVQHGLDCLNKAWNGASGTRLKFFLEDRYPGITEEVGQSFDALRDTLRYHTYLVCLSEHAGASAPDEDLHGRLSMWRAYGRGAGVALVVRQDPLWTADTSLGLFSSPVAYLSDEAFATEFALVVKNIEANAAYLDEIGREQVRNALITAFSAAAVSTKHPGFHEEREWRIVRTPNFPFPCPLEKSTVTVDGIPQSVLLLELKDRAPESVSIEPGAILDRVIIGPTDHPTPISNAYRQSMAAANIADYDAKLTISDLPLRR